MKFDELKIIGYSAMDFGRVNLPKIDLLLLISENHLTSDHNLLPLH